jgi:ribosomal protein L37E
MLMHRRKAFGKKTKDRQKKFDRCGLVAYHKSHSDAANGLALSKEEILLL